jgi:hypothetical protein
VKIGICAICTRQRPLESVALDGRLVFVCAPCNGEHPRQGRYAFAGGVSERRHGIGTDRLGAGNRQRGGAR